MNFKVKKTDVIPFFCILLYVFAFTILGNGSAVAKIAKVFFVGVLLLYLVNGKRIDRSYARWLIGYEAYVLLSITWARQKDYAFESAITVSYTVVCALCIAMVIGYKEVYRNFILKVWVWTPAIHIIIAFLTGKASGLLNFRASADGQIYNVIGQSAFMAAALGYVLYKECGKKWGWLILLNFGIVIISGSRKSLLLLLLFYGIMYVVSSKQPLRVLTKIVVAGILVVIVLLLIKYKVFGEGIYQIYAAIFENNATDNSMIGRLNMIEYSIEKFWEFPWFGHGIGWLEWNCIYKLGQRMPIVDYDYLDVLVDLGIVGEIVFYGFMVICLIKYIQHYKQWKASDKAFFSWIIVQFVYGTICRQYYSNYRVFIVVYLIWMNLKLYKENMGELK